MLSERGREQILQRGCFFIIIIFFSKGGRGYAPHVL